MKIVRNILAVIFGIFIGGIVNLAIISISDSVIPFPDGYDGTSEETMISTFHLLSPKHMIMPFLAHALGTFVGALIAGLIAATHKKTFALVIGFFFLMGGAYMVFILPAPLWFNIVDLCFAYIPVAWVASKMASKKVK